MDEGKQDLGKITAERWNSKQNALNLRAEAIHESFIVDDRSPGTPVGLLCSYGPFTAHAHSRIENCSQLLPDRWQQASSIRPLSSVACFVALPLLLTR